MLVTNLPLTFYDLWKVLEVLSYLAPLPYQPGHLQSGALLPGYSQDTVYPL